MTNPYDLLLGSFQAALDAADPKHLVPPTLPNPPKGRTLVVGAGKAAAAMALAVEAHWPSDAPLEGLVVTRYQHALPTARIRVLEAGHPVPDEAGERAAQEILQRTAELGANDLLLVLLSGGGSSLLSLPYAGLSMNDLRDTTRELLRSGAVIQDMNAVRKHLSAIQGGRLAAASRAPVCALIVSDVTGDDPTHIASGPCAPDPTTYQDAIDILLRHEVRAPGGVVEHLQSGARGEKPETPKPGDPLFVRVQNNVIASAHRSLEAAAAFFRTAGISAAVLGDSVTGEAREVAKVFAAMVREVTSRDQPWTRPVALISGGECTVTLRGGEGHGGRCTEFLLSLGIELAGSPGVHALACDTDGIDGSEDNAGAILEPETLQRAVARGLNPRALLSANDSYSLFAAADSLVVTGPTLTNVNDYRVILVQ